MNASWKWLEKRSQVIRKEEGIGIVNDASARTLDDARAIQVEFYLPLACATRPKMANWPSVRERERENVTATSGATPVKIRTFVPFSPVMDSFIWPRESYKRIWWVEDPPNASSLCCSPAERYCFIFSCSYSSLSITKWSDGVIHQPTISLFFLLHFFQYFQRTCMAKIFRCKTYWCGDFVFFVDVDVGRFFNYGSPTKSPIHLHVRKISFSWSPLISTHFIHWFWTKNSLEMLDVEHWRNRSIFFYCSRLTSLRWHLTWVRKKTSSFLQTNGWLLK